MLGPDVPRVRDLGGLCLQHAVGTTGTWGTQRVSRRRAGDTGAERLWGERLRLRSLRIGSPGCRDHAGHSTCDTEDRGHCQEGTETSAARVGRGHNPLGVKRGREVGATRCRLGIHNEAPGETSPAVGRQPREEGTDPWAGGQLSPPAVLVFLSQVLPVPPGPPPAEVPHQRQAVLGPREEVAAVIGEAEAGEVLVVPVQDGQEVPVGDLRAGER